MDFRNCIVEGIISGGFLLGGRYESEIWYKCIICVYVDMRELK